MSSHLSRPTWKQCALLLILLSHTVFGSPTIPAASSTLESLEPISRADISGAKDLHGSLEENVFGPTLDDRSNRKKRFLGDKLKKAKQAKLLSLGAASSSAAKKIGKSLLKTVATLGVKAIIFNFLFSKINQVLDFKTRLINNLEHKNREQNSQVGIGDASTADSNIITTTELLETTRPTALKLGGVIGGDPLCMRRLDSTRERCHVGHHDNSPDTLLSDLIVDPEGSATSREASGLRIRKEGINGPHPHEVVGKSNPPMKGHKI